MLSRICSSLNKKDSKTTDKGIHRANDILKTARTLFATEGYAGLSMRKVASQLEISLSTVQHYYKDKDTLLIAVIHDILDGNQDAINELLEKMPLSTQLEKLEEVIDFFLFSNLKPDVANVFMEIWSLANRNPLAKKIVTEAREREKKEVMRLIFGLIPEFEKKDYELRSSMFVSLIEGISFAIHQAAPEARAEIAKVGKQNLLQLATSK